MNLFDKLVTEALKNLPDLSPLRAVVEKELLHHDILRILSHHGFLNDLTFIGGTALRSCYGGVRLSEDLDFTGGTSFSHHSLSTMGQILIDNLYGKYGLVVTVSAPAKELKPVATWKIKIETKPKQSYLPSQRINIDICALASYEKQPMLLLNPYGIDMGTNGLIIQTQSREEIYADKLLAFALRENRIKHRDLWDIVWLHQHKVKPRLRLIFPKLQDRGLTQKHFFTLFDQRVDSLSQDKSLQTDFTKEMSRFLPIAEISKSLPEKNLWDFIIYLMGELRSPLNREIFSLKCEDQKYRL